MSRFSRFTDTDTRVICETDNVINHATGDFAGCEGTAAVLNGMIEAYGAGSFRDCDVTTATTTGTTSATTTASRRPSVEPTSRPTTSPITDPCLVYACSADCDGFVVAGGQRFSCGWDHSSNGCIAGGATSAAEAAQLLESAAGACSFHTAASTLSPTPRPSGHPTASPTLLPTARPTGLPSDVPTALPTALPTSVPSEPPTAQPTAWPSIAPTADRCGVQTCSMDCQPGPMTLIAYSGDAWMLQCGWDSNTDRCRWGFVTVPDEAEALLEAVPGACSAYY